VAAAQDLIRCPALDRASVAAARHTDSSSSWIVS
jgi:hypothetical protein